MDHVNFKDICQGRKSCLIKTACPIIRKLNHARKGSNFVDVDYELFVKWASKCYPELILLARPDKCPLLEMVGES